MRVLLPPMALLYQSLPDTVSDRSHHLFAQEAMPVVYHRKQCPGPGVGKKCRWDTRVQRCPASTRDDEVRCRICAAIAGEHRCDASLGLQLVNLHHMDPEMFEGARRALPASIFNLVSHRVKDHLLAAVPTLRRVREEHRRSLLGKSWALMTKTSWMISVWAKEVTRNNDLLNNASVALSLLPQRCFSLVLEYACVDLVSLYRHICTIKSHAHSAFRFTIRALVGSRMLPN